MTQIELKTGLNFRTNDKLWMTFCKSSKIGKLLAIITDSIKIK